MDTTRLEKLSDFDSEARSELHRIKVREGRENPLQEALEKSIEKVCRKRMSRPMDVDKYWLVFLQRRDGLPEFLVKQEWLDHKEPGALRIGYTDLDIVDFAPARGPLFDLVPRMLSIWNSWHEPEPSNVWLADEHADTFVMDLQDLAELVEEALFECDDFDTEAEKRDGIWEE